MTHKCDPNTWALGNLITKFETKTVVSHQPTLRFPALNPYTTLHLPFKKLIVYPYYRPVRVKIKYKAFK